MSEQARYPDRDRSLGDLFKDLVQEVTTLVRQELNLAKTEMGEKAGKIGRHVAFLAAGGAIAYAGLLALLAAVVLLLVQLGLNSWLAALLVGVGVAGVGGALVMSGVNALKNADLTPRETMESLEDVKEDLSGTARIRSRAPG